MSYCAKAYRPGSAQCMEQCDLCRQFEAQDRQRAQKALYDGASQGVQLRLFDVTPYNAMTNFEKVRELPSDLPSSASRRKPSLLPHKQKLLRIALIGEEFSEFVQAKDIVEHADALADLLYVVYGTGVEMGIDLDKVFAEVHRSEHDQARRRRQAHHPPRWEGAQGLLIRAP